MAEHFITSGILLRVTVSCIDVVLQSNVKRYTPFVVHWTREYEIVEDLTVLTVISDEDVAIGTAP